jgi:hypothetical protein
MAISAPIGTLRQRAMTRLGAPRSVTITIVHRECPGLVESGRSG